MTEGFTEELAILRMNGALPGVGSMGSKGKGGGGAGEGLGENQVTEKNMCKVQRLETSSRVEQLQVFQYRWLEDRGEAATRLENRAPGSLRAWSAA